MSELPPEGAASAPTSVPVCPRHPDRESYVRCQRCNRPTCPECQRSAAVGIQCVDCVREQNKGMRIPRTVFGGSAAAVGAAPRVTQALIAVCVVVYVLQRTSPTLTDQFAFSPYQALAEPWRFITSAFLHSETQLLHIVFNMYALWITGPYLESLLGRVRFLTLYLMSAVGGSVAYYFLASPTDGGFIAADWATSVVGASGAVFGLFAALLVVNRRLQRPSGSIMAVIAVNVVLGFLPGIAWQAHLGGALTGLAVTAVLAYAPKERRTPVQVAGLAGILVLLAVLVAVKVATLPAGFPLTPL